jgi:tRNA pseudouridine38-40 synthase
MTVRNIKLTISYDGSSYSGWQYQPGKHTIQGELQQVISTITGFEIKVNGASRTDAGVSALGQVANIFIDTPIPVKNLAMVISKKLPHEIVVNEAVEVEPDFDAARSAKNKMYRYSLFTGKSRPVLRIRNCWHRPGKLNADAMNKAAQFLVGKKDFKSFAAAADKRDSSVRTIFRCDVKSEDKWIYIETEADGFLYNMVRNIVGTLIEIGRGRWTPEKIKEILEAKDRSSAGPTAHPEGLCLIWIKY